MGTIGVILAPASAVAAGSSQTPAARSETQATQQAIAPTNTAAAQAAVVTISAQGKPRAASSGSDKFVDSTFEKQGVKGEKKEKDKKEGGETKGAVNLKA